MALVHGVDIEVCISNILVSDTFNFTLTKNCDVTPATQTLTLFHITSVFLHQVLELLCILKLNDLSDRFMQDS